MLRGAPPESGWSSSSSLIVETSLEIDPLLRFTVGLHCERSVKGKSDTDIVAPTTALASRYPLS